MALIKYSVAIHVVLDGKSYSGSGVWELGIKSVDNAPDAALGFEASVRGEAIWLMASDGTRLLALKRGVDQGSGPDYGSFILLCVSTIQGWSERVRRLQTFEGGCSTTLPRPIIVGLEDYASSAGVRIIPYGASGVSQVVVDVATTDAPLSTGIEEQLPWVRDLPSALSQIAIFPDRIYREDFSTEVAD